MIDPAWVQPIIYASGVLVVIGGLLAMHKSNTSRIDALTTQVSALTTAVTTLTVKDPALQQKAVDLDRELERLRDRVHEISNSVGVLSARFEARNITLERDLAEVRGFLFKSGGSQ